MRPFLFPTNHWMEFVVGVAQQSEDWKYRVDDFREGVFCSSELEVRSAKTVVCDC